jgi:hypothetical protein
MKLQILILVILIINITSAFSQNSNLFNEHVNIFLEHEKNSPITDNYLLYKAQNSFKLIELNDSKINEYTVLNSIEYKTIPSENYSSLTPENFLTLFSNKTINQLLLNVKRDRFNNVYYRLGSTNFVLIGHSEEQLYTEFNKLNK